MRLSLFMVDQSRKNKLFVWGHRGACAIAPENTMSAFVAAEEAGADGVELDVHLSRDGVPVVIHDLTVDRTTDGHGAVADFDLAELLELDAGSWFASRYAGESIPLLAEVLAWAGSRLWLNIELKDEAAGLAVLDLLKQFPESRVLVSSFNHMLLQRLRQSDPQLPLAFLTDSPFWRLALRRAIACSAEAFHPNGRYLTRNLVASCHRHGLKVSPWSDGPLLRPADMQRRGVDGYFSDNP